MPLTALDNDLKNGLKPVYLIAGPQPFQREMALRRVMAVAEIKRLDQMNCDVFLAGRDDASDLARLANSLPMLAKRRLIVLQDAHKLKAAEKERLVGYLQSPAPFTTLVLLSEKVDNREKLTKLASKHGFVLTFERLYESKVRPWIEMMAHSQGLTLDRRAVDFLVQNVGADLSAIWRELEKASLHAGSNQVGVENLTAVISSVKEQSLFGLMDAITKKSKAESLLLLKQILDQGEAPLAVLSVLGRQIRQLCLAKELAGKRVDEGQAAAMLGTSPFFAKKIREQSERFSNQSLRDGLLMLSQVDLELKDGRSNERAILEKLVLGLCGRL